MSERLHDYTEFQTRLHRWVMDSGNPELIRSWRIMRGCVTVHVMVDAKGEGGLEEALRVTWQDVHGAFAGLSSTFTMEALANDMLLASGGVDPPLLVVVDEAFASASQPIARKRAKTTFTALEGGKS
jgi:hypothetical protein